MALLLLFVAAVALNAIFFILYSSNSGRSPFPRLCRGGRRRRNGDSPVCPPALPRLQRATTA